MGWLSKLFNLEAFEEKSAYSGNGATQDLKNSRDDARNRLKLVLMHDRSKLAPQTLEKMRDELIAVITKYVEIDGEALRLNFETESNTIALMANIPVLRQKETDESEGGPAATTTDKSGKTDKPTKADKAVKPTKDKSSPAALKEEPSLV